MPDMPLSAQQQALSKQSSVLTIHSFATVATVDCHSEGMSELLQQLQRLTVSQKAFRDYYGICISLIICVNVLKMSRLISLLCTLNYQNAKLPKYDDNYRNTQDSYRNMPYIHFFFTSIYVINTL
jgi:hypothetical protein